MELNRFKRYEEEFLNSTRIVARELRNLEVSNGNVEQVTVSCVEIEGEISEAEGYMRAMDVEFRALGSADKRYAQTKVTEFREELKQLLQRYQTAKFNAEAQALKGGPNARSKLLTANDKLDNSTALLEQSRMVLAQTEQTGNVILTDMSTQKETLMDAQDKVKDTRQYTVDARKILRAMGNRAIRHKVCVAFTIIILAGVIAGIGYMAFVKK